MLRKMSIVPVALVAMYLFACNSVNDNFITNDNEGQVFTLHEVEIKPMFNGKPVPIDNKDWEDEFVKFVNQNAIYPPKAIENGITGRVFAEFDINLDGIPTNVNIIRGADPLLNAEVLRVINSSPKWTPGRHKGETVKVRYSLPFSFMIK